jgi:MHS family proline/betaine transporter-like MFS transporter
MSIEEANRTRRKVVAAGIAGNVMEWYDFAVYGYLARTIGNLYFPADDPKVSLLVAYGAFAAGFLMRPLGAVLFGYIGDRVGRGPSLLWSVVVMAAPTFAIGLLPTYNQIGISASVLMLVFRLLQGLAVGGEYTGSAVFLAETAHPDRRGFAAAWAPFGAIGGILLGSAAGTVVFNTLGPDQVVAWGWRVPFLLGVVVGGVGFILRRRMPHDVPAAKKGFPLIGAIQENPVQMLQVMALSLVNAVVFYLIFVYIIAWLKQATNIRAAVALEINSLNMAIMLGVILFFAWLSDRIGRKPILAGAAVGLTVFAWPLMALMQTGSITLVFLGQLGFALLVGAYSAVIPITMCEIFPRQVRCSAVSTAYNITLGIAGGTAPAVATWLIDKTGDTLIPAFYITLASALAAGAALSLHPRAHQAIADSVIPHLATSASTGR